jgi:tetratricopeptide (TPR) repeat protein
MSESTQAIASHVRLDNVDALEEDRRALDMRAPGHPDRSRCLYNLATRLQTRNEELGDLDSLAEAVDLHRQALDLRPRGHPDRSMSLNNLANALATQFVQLEDLDSLAEAVDLHRQALDLHPQGHPDRSMSLNNLATALQTRFEQLGDPDSLAEAVRLHRQALDLLPQGHPDCSMSFSNLAAALWSRFKQLGDLDSLAEAVGLHRQALDLRPPGHPDRSMSLNNLANALATRFEQLGDLDSLAEAVGLHRQALDLRPQGHPDRLSSLINLAFTVHTQSKSLNNISDDPTVHSSQRCVSDLDEELRLYQEGLHSCSGGHPMRIRFLFATGTCLLRTETHVHNFEVGISNILEALRDQASPARQALRHTFEALPMVGVAYQSSTEHTGNVELGRHHHHDLVLQVYILAIRLLPRVARFGLDHAGRLRELSGAETISRDAATWAIAAGRNTEAVEMLEEGRGVFWTQALRLRTTDLDLLPAQNAQELRRLFHTLEMGSVGDEMTSIVQRERLIEQRRRLSNTAEALIADIRSRPGMSRFMLPPAFSSLVLSLPDEGFVVLLVTSYLGHHALVLDRVRGQTSSLELFPPEGGFFSEAVRVSLPRDGGSELHHTEDTDVSRAFGVSKRANRLPKEPLNQTLAQLWTLIVKPVIGMLGLKVCLCSVIRVMCTDLNFQKAAGSGRSRVWWCVTAKLTFLPIHAAGITEGNAMESASDYFVSSYIPTLSALSRCRIDWRAVPSTKVTAILAVCKDSPGWSSLANVEREIEVTKACFKDASAQVLHSSSPNTTAYGH